MCSLRVARPQAACLPAAAPPCEIVTALRRTCDGLADFRAPVVVRTLIGAAATARRNPDDRNACQEHSFGRHAWVFPKQVLLRHRRRLAGAVCVRDIRNDEIPDRQVRREPAQAADSMWRDRSASCRPRDAGGFVRCSSTRAAGFPAGWRQRSRPTGCAGAHRSCRRWTQGAS